MFISGKRGASVIPPVWAPGKQIPAEMIDRSFSGRSGRIRLPPEKGILADIFGQVASPEIGADPQQGKESLEQRRCAQQVRFARCEQICRWLGGSPRAGAGRAVEKSTRNRVGRSNSGEGRTSLQSLYNNI